MLKREAFELLGGKPAAIAREIGANVQAVLAWPEVLSERVEDRVLAALYRREHPDKFPVRNGPSRGKR